MKRKAENSILNGVTRRRVFALVKELGVKVQEPLFSLDEKNFTREAFLTSTTAYVMAVVKIDDAMVRNRRSGIRTMRL